MYRNLDSQKGQGLLEMIVAITIIVVGIASTVTLVTASLGAASEGEMRLIATNLGREGIEVVRNLRDSNWLAAESWNEGLTDALFDRTAVPIYSLATNDWILSFFADDFTNDQTIVYRLTAGDIKDGLYQFTAAPPDGEPTVFRRLIALQPICRTAGAETVVEGNNATCTSGVEVGLDVRSTVSWTIKGRTKELTVEEKIYDWR